MKNSSKFLIIKKYIDGWDPVDLLGFAPKDEYDIESEMIAERIKISDSAEEIADTIIAVFCEMFSKDCFKEGYSEGCRKVSQMIKRDFLLEACKFSDSSFKNN